MRIFLTGSQGTGKSTVLKYFNHQMPTITEVVRELSKKGVNINEGGDEKGQKRIFNEYNKLLNKTDHFMSDRCLVDVYAYSLYHFNHGNLSLDELSREAGEIEKMATQDDILWVYFPIEFEVEDDGVRSTNENYRQEIDTYILSTLSSFGIDYKTVRGSLTDRVKQIESWIQEKLNKQK